MNMMYLQPNEPAVKATTLIIKAINGTEIHQVHREGMLTLTSFFSTFSGQSRYSLSPHFHHTLFRGTSSGLK